MTKIFMCQFRLAVGSKISLYNLRSFWYLHVQPPIYDFMRYVLSHEGLAGSSVASGKVLDGRIYLFYYAIYGAFNQLIYFWSRALGFSKLFSIIFVIVWAIYPGNLAMTTLLESTYLSAFFIAWTTFLLYLYLRRPTVSGLALFLASFLLTSWTRTVFQIHLLVLLPVIVTSFVIMFHRESLVRASIIALPLVMVCFFLPFKQHSLYGTFATTTFAGQHKIEGIWYRPTPAELNSIEVPTKYVLNALKLQNKYNSVEQLITNYRYENIFSKLIISQPGLVMDGVKKSFMIGLSQVRIPTQDYQPNRLIESLSWVHVSRVLSGGLSYFSVALIGLSGYLLAMHRQFIDARPRYLIIIGFIGLVFITIIVGSNRYEWTEAERLKFLIEAPFLLLSIHGVRLLIEALRGYTKRVSDSMSSSEPSIAR